MKINAEVFIQNIEKYELENKIFLISGNEPGLIIKIQNLILKKLAIKKKFHKEILDYKNFNSSFNEELKNRSLFDEFRVLQIINFTDSFVKSLESISIENSCILLIGQDTKSSSKIKRFFDNHKVFFSVVCYKLSQGFKKGMVDRYISENNIHLTKEAYWYFFEKTGEDYQFIENELEKIKIFNKKMISLDDIKRLLSNVSALEFNELFFHCALGNKKLIIDNSQGSIKSSSDAYSFLQIIKFFCKILTTTSEKKAFESSSSLAKQYLPKYLFKQQKNFEIIVGRASLDKLVSINRLLQKTELVLRSNDENYLMVMQRFMLNFAKILK